MSTTMKDLKLTEVQTNGNVRTVTDASADKELVASVQEHGVIEPIVVRRDGTKHILIAGHRRLDAARKAKLKVIPARILDVTKDKAIELQIVENLQRKDLTALEEAYAYKALADRGGTEKVWDHKGKKLLPGAEFLRRVALIAKIVGKSTSHVMRSLRLIELPKNVQSWMQKGKLTGLHAMLLIDLPQAALDNVVAKFLLPKMKDLKENDVFPVSDLKRYIDSTFAKDLKTATFPTDIHYAGEVACTACPHNSGNAMSLFGKEELGSCRLNACFKKKSEQVYKDAREKFASKFDKKVRFKGYSRMVSKGYTDKVGRLPYRIKQNLVLRDSSKLQKALKEHPEYFGWSLVKPLEDTKNPKCQAVVVSVADPHVAKLLGLNIKKLDAKAKEDTQGSDRDWKKQSFIQQIVQAEVSKRINIKLAGLKPSQEVTDAYFMDQYERDVKNWKEAGKIVGISLKGRSPLKGLKMDQVGLVAFAAAALGYDGAALLGINKDEIRKQVEPEALKQWDNQEANSDSK